MKSCSLRFYETMKLFLLPLVGLLLSMASCTSPHGKVVSAEYLSRYEGGGSLSTLWYYGADEKYHYFRHSNKTNTPFRIRKDGFQWPEDRAFTGYEEGDLIRDELSRHYLLRLGIQITPEVSASDVLAILAVRPKQKHETWKVDKYGKHIRIQTGSPFPSPYPFEIWAHTEDGGWTRIRQSAESTNPILNPNTDWRRTGPIDPRSIDDLLTPPVLQ